jgi:type I protein arginine methyltransferase
VNDLGGRAGRILGRVLLKLRQNRHVRGVWNQLHNLHYFADLTKHDDMLADRPRVDTYFNAINRYVNDGDEVIDLGTGSGVLACFSANAGASRVHAVEYGPIIAAAQQVAAANRLTNIEFHRVNSQALELPRKVDVIVHEQIGAALFNENAVANLVDLRDRLLKDGGRILPHRLELWVMPFQATDDGTYAPFAWEQTLHGVSFSALKPFAEEHPDDYVYRVYNPLPVQTVLADPQPLVTVDLHTATDDRLPTEAHYSSEVREAGVLHGFCVYFRAGFDDELWLTSAPGDPGRAFHWPNPVLRVQRETVEPGDVLSLRLQAADLTAPETWRWDHTVTRAAARPTVAVDGSVTT